MPRVILNKQKYMVEDLFDYIVCEMKRQKITQSELADKLDINQCDLSRKIKNRNLNAVQLMIVFKELNTSEEKIGRMMKL